VPDENGIEPGYEQKTFPPEPGKLRLVASHDGSDGSLTIHQDTKLFAATLAKGDTVNYDLAEGRYGWLQVARGTVDLNGKKLQAGDGASIEDERSLKISGEGEILFFDLS